MFSSPTTRNDCHICLNKPLPTPIHNGKKYLNHLPTIFLQLGETLIMSTIYINLKLSSRIVRR